jgi:hypothetical protein
MLLSREGELSREEVADLIAHLSGCAACAREAALSGDVERQIRVIRTIPVAGGDPGELTRRILRATAEPGERAAATRGVRSNGGPLEHGAMPAVSFAAAAMLLLVVASALWQAGIVAGEVRQLEARQSRQAVSSRPMPTVRYAVDVQQATELLGPGAVQAVRTHGVNGTILVSEQTLHVVRGGGMPGQSYLSRWNVPARERGTLESLRSGAASMVWPVLSLRNATGV